MIGAALAGILLHLRDAAQRKYSRLAEHRALVIEKYEQLHQELTNIDSSIGNLGIELIGVAGLGHKVDLQQYSDKIPVSSALMHAEFYAPEILPHLESLKPKLAEFYRIIFKLESDRNDKELERLALAESGIEISNKITEIIKSANKELAKLAREAIHGA